MNFTGWTVRTMKRDGGGRVTTQHVAHYPSHAKAAEAVGAAPYRGDIVKDGNSYNVIVRG